MDTVTPPDTFLSHINLDPRFLTPAGFKWGTFTTAEGAKLRYGHVATPGATKACVLVGGFAEFIEKYFETVHDLADRGFAVWCLDWQGQGGSERPKQFPSRPHARNYDHDATALADFAAAMLPSAQPRLLVAHSMGAAIGLLSLSQHRGMVDAAVLSAPMLALPVGAIAQGFAGALAFVAVKLGMGEHFVPGAGPWTAIADLTPERSRTSHDPLRCLLQRTWFEANPDLRIDGPTYGWVHAALGLMKRLRDPHLLASITTPILLGSAQKELYVNPRSHEAAAAKLPHCHLVKFPEAKHELFCETDSIRNAWLSEIDAFIGKNLGKAKAATA